LSGLGTTLVNSNPRVWQIDNLRVLGFGDPLDERETPIEELVQVLASVASRRKRLNSPIRRWFKKLSLA
jgi:hypothetical protein